MLVTILNCLGTVAQSIWTSPKKKKKHFTFAQTPCIDVSTKLSFCELFGFIPPPIPNSINFSSLTTLDLSTNFFENSSILFWVFGLYNLVSLDLSYNWFPSPILVHLQNLTSLRHLDLSWNDFNSSIPNWLYSFSHLEFSTSRNCFCKVQSLVPLET